MKITAVNNNFIKRQTFKGYDSAPGDYAVRAQMISAQDADRFVKSMKEADRTDATTTNFMKAFVNKLVLAGEILGFGNLKQAGEIMKTPEHKKIVKTIDKGVEDMLEATGYGYGVLWRI